MPDYMHLIGSEQVQSAGSEMRRAAEDMQRAASSFYGTMQQHQRFMDDWLQRFEAVLVAADSGKSSNG